MLNVKKVHENYFVFAQSLFIAKSFIFSHSWGKVFCMSISRTLFKTRIMACKQVNKHTKTHQHRFSQLISISISWIMRVDQNLNKTKLLHCDNLPNIFGQHVLVNLSRKINECSINTFFPGKYFLLPFYNKVSFDIVSASDKDRWLKPDAYGT